MTYAVYINLLLSHTSHVYETDFQCQLRKSKDFEEYRQVTSVIVTLLWERFLVPIVSTKIFCTHTTIPRLCNPPYSIFFNILDILKHVLNVCCLNSLVYNFN